MKKKELRSPLNLLTVNQCFFGMLSNVLNGFLTLISHPIILYYGSCAIEFIISGSLLWTHFGVNTVNITAIAIAIYFTLKYNNTSRKLTYRQVVIVIVVVWVYPALWAIGLTLIIIDRPTFRCLLYTDDHNIDIANIAELRTPLLHIITYVARDITVDMVCRIIVIIFCVASYKLF